MKAAKNSMHGASNEESNSETLVPRTVLWNSSCLLSGGLPATTAILGDGSVVASGHPCCGGDSSAVQDQLRSARQIQATLGAFAAILEDGSLVAWGLAGCGGDSSTVQNQLRSVPQIRATDPASGAVLEDGSAVTWGSPHVGGNSSCVADRPPSG